MNVKIITDRRRHTLVSISPFNLRAYQLPAVRDFMLLENQHSASETNI